MPAFPDLAALNAWLQERCLALWRETPHGKQPGTIADVWSEEKAALMPRPMAFDGFVELSKRVSPTCLISFERSHRNLVIGERAAATVRVQTSPSTNPELDPNRLALSGKVLDPTSPPTMSLS